MDSISQEYRCWDDGRPPQQARVQFLGRWSGTRLDVMAGSVESPCYAARHHRKIMFIDGEYWLIVDQLSSPRSHTFDLHFHLTPIAQGKVAVQRLGMAWVLSSPGLILVALGGSQLDVLEGWVAPSYGVKYAAPIARIHADGRQAEFLTLVVPLAPGAGSPRIDQVDCRLEEHSVWVSISWHRPAPCRDVVSWRDEPESLRLTGSEITARVAWRRETLSGAILDQDSVVD